MEALKFFIEHENMSPDSQDETGYTPLYFIEITIVLQQLAMIIWKL